MSKRLTCRKCAFIESRCLCQFICTIYNKTHIIVLQHPSEAKHSLNTVKLMQLCFDKIQVFVGEDFSNHLELNEIIKNNMSKLALLYPENSQSPSRPKSLDIEFIIILDGTWRKAYKIYALSKNLHNLQRISFDQNINSNYRIRSSSKKNSLSSIEAAIEALKEIEPNLDTSSSLNLFNKMINFQIEKMGEDIFKKNYKKKGSD